MTDQINLAWVPPGPLSARFMASTKRVQILNGPVGSGKTTTVFQKHIRNAGLQQPARQARTRVKVRGGSELWPVRLYKVTTVRDDYRQLWRATIPSWNSRYPQSLGKWTGARNAPAMHELLFALPDGTAIEFIHEFVAIGDNDIEEFMRGYEPTAFNFEELDLLAMEVLRQGRFRWGRYPRMDEGGPSWYGATATCNAPIIDGEFYNEIFLNTPDDVDLVRLPGAFDPGAENRQNLPAGYYEGHLQGDKYLVKRMVHNQPAPSRSGKPVHEEFNDFLHVAATEIEAIPGLPLVLGMDAGGDPCAAFNQKLAGGRWNCIDELVSEHGTGAVKFANRLNEFLMDRYPGWHRMPTSHEREWGWNPLHGLPRPNITAWCDPAATYGGDANSAAEADWAWCDIVSYRTGIRVQGAPTNNTTDRREAMKRMLEHMPDGRPGFQLSPRCKMIRAGLAGQFRYRKMQIAREERYTDEVDKNAHSHPCEAEEYALLGGGEGHEVHQRRERSGFGMGHSLPTTAADFDGGRW